MIYVMGDGFLLEHGIHDELMARRGAYAKLVQMQRLHEDQQASRVGAVKAEEREGLKKATEDDELPRRLRPDTATSLTSQILAQRGQTPGGKEGDYSLAYLSKRMWLINPEGRKSYIMGFMAAAGKYFVTNR
jgi:ATP-binding cassette subfamily B (MDR/TAP) protein 1